MASARRRSGSLRRVRPWFWAGALCLLAVGFVLWRWSAGSKPATSSPSGVAVELNPPRDLEQHSPTMEPEPPPVTVPAGTAGKVAIVIDDLGRSLVVVEELFSIGADLSYSVLPYESRTSEVVARLVALDAEILCHLPMEADEASDPGPGALQSSMTSPELAAATRAALAAVPGAVGVNNHMGSVLTENRLAMRAVLEVLGAEDLFFLDSRTTAGSVGYSLARELDLAAVERKVFLDRERSVRAIQSEFRRLLALAAAGEQAVAIGHPYPETRQVLRAEIPRAVALGYRFVRVSELFEAGLEAAAAPM